MSPLSGVDVLCSDSCRSQRNTHTLRHYSGLTHTCPEDATASPGASFNGLDEWTSDEHGPIASLCQDLCILLRCEQSGQRMSKMV